MVLSRVNLSDQDVLERALESQQLYRLYNQTTSKVNHTSRASSLGYHGVGVRIDIEVAEACSCQENRCFVFLKRGW